MTRSSSGDEARTASDLAVAVSVVGLEKHYSGRKVVDGLTFTVPRGEVFGLLGPNGAGKTTTVEILEGYRDKDAGEVRVLGLDPVADGAPLRARIGVMLQEGGLYPGLRPLEILRLFASYYDTPEDPETLLRRVGLDEVRRTTVRRLSGGQAQRLSLACALIGRPDLVFLDEPTAGMDLHARGTTWELVRELQARGTTVMLTTHSMDEAEELCDRVAIIAAGRLAAVGTPRELTRAPRAEAVTFTTGRAIDVTALARALGLGTDRVQSARAGEYTVLAAGSPALVAALTAFLADHDIALGILQANERSLEDVFLALTAEASTPGRPADEPARSPS